MADNYGFNSNMYPSAPSMDDDTSCSFCNNNNNVNRAWPVGPSCPHCSNRPHHPHPHGPPGHHHHPPPHGPHHPPHHGPPGPHHPPPHGVPGHHYPPHGPGHQYPPGSNYPNRPGFPQHPPTYPTPNPIPSRPSNPTPMPMPTLPTQPGYPIPAPRPKPTPRPPTNNTNAYYWVDTQARGLVPTTALRGGVDSDGHTIYVGRAFHEGDWLPAKVIPGKQVAYICYNGDEHAKGEFQVLCEQRFDWVPNNGGFVPPGAVEGGRTSDGETLYIGRVNHEGSVTVGKVHPSHGVLYIPYGGKEHGYQDYEILVLRA